MPAPCTYCGEALFPEDQDERCADCRKCDVCDVKIPDIMNSYPGAKGNILCERCDEAETAYEARRHARWKRERLED